MNRLDFVIVLMAWVGYTLELLAALALTVRLDSPSLESWLITLNC